MAAYIGSVMNNSVSNTVRIEFSKYDESIEIGWTYRYWCLFVVLFGSRLS